jgi:hypothetical protein
MGAATRAVMRSEQNRERPTPTPTSGELGTLSIWRAMCAWGAHRYGPSMTMQTPSSAHGATAGVVLLCTLAGCSASPPEAPASAAAWADSRLGAYLGAYRNAGTARQVATAVRWGEAVAACMKPEGFEYVPFDGITVSTFSPDPDSGSPAWTAEYGYGITSRRNVTRSRPDDQHADPNQPIVAAMSPAERDAYNAALDSAGDLGTAPGSEVGSAAPADHGCAGSATTSTGSDWQHDPTYTQLDADYTALLAQVDADPGVVATLADWRACMAAGGHPGLTTPSDARMSIQTAMDGLAGPDTPVSDTGALAELRDREIDLAVDDRVCAVDARVDRTRIDVQRSIESAYVEAHRAELDAWIELYGGLGE